MQFDFAALMSSLKPTVCALPCSRYPIQSVLQLYGHSTRQPHSPPQQQQRKESRQQESLLLRWANRVAPVANLVLSGLRVGTSSGAEGALAAKLQLSSALLVNLQLLDLCKSPATCPSAAGLYLPSGYAVPQERARASRTGSAADSTRGSAAAQPARLSANFNAFVLAPYTSRLIAACHAAALHRWQLLGLSRLASDSTGSAAARGLGRGLNAQAQASTVSTSSSAAGASQQQQSSRGWVSRRVLLRRQWQQVLELRAFVKSLDYAMFLVFHQQAQRAVHGEGPYSAAASAGGGSSAEPCSNTAAEQYQVLYKMYLGELEASTAAPESPGASGGWFASRRNTRTNSIGGVGAGASAAAASAAGSTSVSSSPAAASLGSSIPGSPSLAAALDHQGSVYDWRKGHMRDTLRHRLSTAERASSAHTSPSLSRDGSGLSFLYAAGSLPSVSNGHAAAGRGALPPAARQPMAAPVRLRDGGHSFTGEMNGLPPVAERTRVPAAPPAAVSAAGSRAAAAASPGPAPSAMSAAGGAQGDSFSSDSSSPAEAPVSPMGGMQMFNALRSLRSGSSFLLSTAAQQLRLRKRQHQQQQQRQLNQPVQGETGHARSPSRLGPRPDPAALGRTGLAGPANERVEQQQQQQLPQGWGASGASSFQAVGAAVGAASVAETVFTVRDPQQLQQQSQQQRWELLLDFLGAFALELDDALVVPAVVNCDGAQTGTCTGLVQQRALAVASSRQPQLSLSYLQQHSISTRQHLQQQADSRGAGRMQLPAQGAGPLPDQLTMNLGHLKLVLGPHSVSMGLQLVTSLLGATTSGRPVIPTPKTAGSTSSSGTAAQHAAVPGAGTATAGRPAGSSSTSSSSSSSSPNGTRPGGLTMRLQLSVCHLAVNMERMVTADMARGAAGSTSRPHGALEALETKGLLSLLLLDANSSVLRGIAAGEAAGAEGTAGAQGARGLAGSGMDSAEGSAQQGGVRVTCSVAHVGLQDLCAPLEQRHVLSGAREAYKVGGMRSILS